MLSVIEDNLKPLDMKISCIFVLVSLFYFTCANDAPGFFLKTTKNIPRLGKRVFIKQGSKNIPRLGRRSDPNETNEIRNYNHVQPMDSKFLFDFLSEEIFIGDGDLKFLSWDDLDKALESDSELKKKLTSIARDKEVEELRKFAYGMNLVDQQFIPYDNQRNVQNNENDVYYYYTSHDDKRAGPNPKSTKLF